MPDLGHLVLDPLAVEEAVALLSSAAVEEPGTVAAAAAEGHPSSQHQVEGLGNLAVVAVGEGPSVEREPGLGKYDAGPVSMGAVRPGQKCL